MLMNTVFLLLAFSINVHHVMVEVFGIAPAYYTLSKECNVHTCLCPLLVSVCTVYVSYSCTS
jgi:hypothetical protein